MGRLEKIIVLSVLFLVTLILVVSLNTSEEPGGFSSDPRIDQLLGPAAAGSGTAAALAAAPRTGSPDGEPAAGRAPTAADPNGPAAPLARQDDDAGWAAGASLAGLPERADLVARGADEPDSTGRDGSGSAGAGRRPERLLSSTVERPEPGRDGAPVAAERAEDAPAGSILVTTRGLEESYLDEYRFYTLRAGDDFGVLAERFYGDRRRVGLLRGANEGHQSFVTGDTILVPVYAPELPDDRRAALAGPGAADAVYHVVRDGDSLWKIAQEHYGRGTRWREIFDANRDRMATEDALTVGMRLRIP